MLKQCSVVYACYHLRCDPRRKVACMTLDDDFNPCSRAQYKSNLVHIFTCFYPSGWSSL